MKARTIKRRNHRRVKDRAFALYGDIWRTPSQAVHVMFGIHRAILQGARKCF